MPSWLEPAHVLSDGERQRAICFLESRIFPADSFASTVCITCSVLSALAFIAACQLEQKV